MAIIDSGVEDGHPLVGHVDRAIAVERDDSNDDGARFVDAPHDDLYGHGTACAGIIRSLAPKVEIISIRVLSSNLKGNAFAFAHGLDWCIDNGVHVANLSLSTANEDYAETFLSSPTRPPTDSAAGVGTQQRAQTQHPQRVRRRVLGRVHARHNREAFWFNPSGPAEWGAAGIDVDVPWSGGGTINASGNSFAAPVIAGHLARIVGAHPGITPWQARTVLAALAENAAP